MIAAQNSSDVTELITKFEDIAKNQNTSVIGVQTIGQKSVGKKRSRGVATCEIACGTEDFDHVGGVTGDKYKIYENEDEGIYDEIVVDDGGGGGGDNGGGGGNDDDGVKNEISGERNDVSDDVYANSDCALNCTNSSFALSSSSFASSSSPSLPPPSPPPPPPSSSSSSSSSAAATKSSASVATTTKSSMTIISSTQTSSNVTSSTVTSSTVTSLTVTSSNVTSRSTSSADSLSTQPWYFDCADREEVDDILSCHLKQNGTFTVRPSKRGGATNPYTLSIIFNEHIYHVSIRKRKEDGKYALGNPKPDEKKFVSVVDLVNFYKDNEVRLLESSGKHRGSIPLGNYPSKN